MSALPKVISMDEHRKIGPQLEDGHVRVANELYDAILEKLNTYRHLKVALAIVRKTYGYRKKEDDLTVSQLAKLTGIHRNNVGKALTELEEAGVINPVRPGEHGLIIGINKHHEEWATDEKKERGPGRSSIKLVLDGNQIDCEASNQNVAQVQSKQCIEAIKTLHGSNQNVAHNIQPQKTTPKDNPNNTQSADCGLGVSVDQAFEQFWDAFADKRDKEPAKGSFIKAMQKARSEGQDLAEWLKAVLHGARKEAERRPFLKASGTKIKMAQGWLTSGRWNNEDLLTWGAFSAEQQAFIDCFNANIGDTCPQVTEWTEKRAALADIAMRGSWELDKWAEFWRYVADECQFDWPVSFEWMLNRENWSKVKGGQYLRKEVTA